MIMLSHGSTPCAVTVDLIRVCGRADHVVAFVLHHGLVHEKLVELRVKFGALVGILALGANF